MKMTFDSNFVELTNSNLKKTNGGGSFFSYLGKVYYYAITRTNSGYQTARMLELKKNW